MYSFLLHLHSGLRWAVLLLMIVAILNGFKKWKAGDVYTTKDKLINLLAMISMHTQFLIGLILYFISDKMAVFWENPGDWIGTTVGRFYLVEHITAMTLAAVLITIGRKRAEKSTSDRPKHRKIFVWYLIVLIIIMASIPWPFRIEGAGWF